LHEDEELIVVGNAHQRELMDGALAVGVEGTPQRGECFGLARISPNDIARLQVDDLKMAVHA
jgi:hypothetical protein